MITLTADASMLAILSQAKGLAEVRDANGKVIGFYAPTTIKDAQAYANAAAHVDRAEMERQKQSEEICEPLEIALHRLSVLEAEIERRKAAGETEWSREEALAYFRSLRQKANDSPRRDEGNTAPPEGSRCVTR